MIFPVKTTDLTNVETSTDEEATYVVVESIINSTFDELKFSEEIDIAELKHRVLNDEKFDEVSNSIVNQKNIMTSFLGDNITSISPEKLAKIQSNVSDEIERSTVKFNRSYKKLSVAAASIIVVGISMFSFTALKYSDDTATKSRSSQTEQYSSESDEIPGREGSDNGIATNSDSVSGVEKAQVQLSLQPRYRSLSSLYEGINNSATTLIDRFNNKENVIRNYSNLSLIDGISLGKLFECPNVQSTFANNSIFTTLVDDQPVYVLVGNRDNQIKATIFNNCDASKSINLN